MSIFVDENTKVIVQGLTGARAGSTDCATATTAPRSSAA
jgi:succinyl-CoA synthetase alpha subunit